MGHSEWSTPFLPHDGETSWRWVDSDYNKHPWVNGSEEESAAADLPPIKPPAGWQREAESWAHVAMNEPCDLDGWQYGVDFFQADWLWGASDTACHCRRRQWKCTFTRVTHSSSRSRAQVEGAARRTSCLASSCCMGPLVNHCWSGWLRLANRRAYHVRAVPEKK